MLLFIFINFYFALFTRLPKTSIFPHTLKNFPSLESLPHRNSRGGTSWLPLFTDEIPLKMPIKTIVLAV